MKRMRFFVNEHEDLKGCIHAERFFISFFFVCFLAFIDITYVPSRVI